MEESKEQDPFRIFSTRNFVRSLSYREFVTSLILALLLLVFYSILDFFFDGNSNGGNQNAIRWTLFLIIAPLNHIFYRKQHKRPNNFIGRNLHDYIFLLLFGGVYKLYSLLSGNGFSITVAGPGSMIVFLLIFIVMVMLFETAVAFVKLLLRLFKWQIL